MTRTTEKPENSLTAFLVPVNVNKSTRTTEFHNNFNQNEQVLFNDQTLNANYLTGKKLLSKEISSTGPHLHACMVDINTTQTGSGTDSTTKVTPIKNIANINLSEREGNEYVLFDEVNKFNEFIELVYTIHN
ncbi:hypothetical protein C6P45_003854 [Maudiozyma exigua]|uniref:Uncharacterized protein n=1 Tax=Maudiozyma exigua TaxID=34358 RepID=A0A9P6VRI1_MAUEX|nr:hypothetical protein C6P45_003854 [Kazachstania exigua]